jgi:hypothetical protein
MKKSDTLGNNESYEIITFFWLNSGVIVYL